MTEDPDKFLKHLSTHFVGLFTFIVGNKDNDDDFILHALWILAKEAERQRDLWKTMKEFKDD